MTDRPNEQCGGLGTDLRKYLFLLGFFLKIIELDFYQLAGFQGRIYRFDKRRGAAAMPDDD